jgi:osmotically-inducible protein OsmY
MNIKKISVLCLTLLALQGCVPILLGGAVVAATATYVVMNDHRSPSTKRTDTLLQKTIEQKLNADTAFKQKCHLIVSVFRGTVLLTGQCPNNNLKLQAQRIAASASGISQLYNEINIEAPNSSLTRMSDDWISTKIRFALHKISFLQSAEYQIVTENGVVYVMGKMTQPQAKALVNAVRDVDGVQKVVKMISLVTSS